MSEQFYDYDRNLFARTFLNCAQRHSIVMLAERGVEVAGLFSTCHVPTDVILDQCILKRVPKYDFAYDGLTDDDYLAVGVERTSHFVESFESVRPLVAERIVRDGFVLLAGDVFYFEHCPEFRKAHLFHLVVLEGYDLITDFWSLIDDNPASVLCRYRYPTANVASFYDNNSVREVRTYAMVGTTRRAALIERFVASRIGRVDSLRLLTGMEDMFASPWSDGALLCRHLSDAMSILAGSRRCLAAFLRTVLSQSVAADKAQTIAEDALKLRDVIVMAGMTGQTRSSHLRRRASELAEAERSLSTTLDAISTTPGFRGQSHV